VRQCDASIPYEEIDCEIRHLVRLMNGFPGIRTTGSCAGHGVEADGETEVNFVADSQASAARLLSAMPYWGLRAGFVSNQPQVKSIWAMVHPDAAMGGLLFSLRIGGSPRYAQREAIGDVEQALAASLQLCSS
jgi:hypothetical protein